MSAEELCQAAALMRERAEAATPGPWERCQWYGYKVVGRVDWGEGYGVRPATVGHADPAPGASRPTRVESVIESTNARNGDHIASWHPAVALAVADWLEAEAENHDDRVTVANRLHEDAGSSFRFTTLPVSPQAIAVARAYLRSES